MKIIITILFLLTISTLAHAELRTIAISGKAIKEETRPNAITINGFTYSLATGIRNEELKAVSIREIAEGLSKVRHAGSAIWVAIYSEDYLPAYDLKVIIDALSKNPYFELIYLKTGKNGRAWGEKILREHNVKSEQND